MTQTIIRIKVPTKMKKEMDEIRINWNDYIYQCILEKLEQQNESSISRV